MKKGRTQGTGAGLPLSAMNEMYKKTLPVQYSTAWDRITLKTYLSRMKDNLCIICVLYMRLLTVSVCIAVTAQVLPYSSKL